MSTNYEHLSEEARMALSQDPVCDIQFSTDGDLIAVARGSSVLIYSAQTGEEISLIKGHVTPIKRLLFAPDRKTLLSVCEEGTIQVSRTSTGRCTRTIHNYDGDCFAFSPDGNTFAARAFAMSDTEVDKIHIFDIATATKHQTLTTDSRNGILDVVFSPDAKMIALNECERDVFDSHCPISLWDIRTGKRLKTLTTVDGGAYAIAFSPDAKTLADSGGLSDNRIALWDVVTGEQRCAFIWKDRFDHADSLAFSPDGRTLVSGHSDGPLHLWDVTTGEHLKTFTGHTAKISSLCFSPDGCTLATGCANGTVMFWDIATESE